MKLKSQVKAAAATAKNINDLIVPTFRLFEHLPREDKDHFGMIENFIESAKQNKEAAKQIDSLLDM